MFGLRPQELVFLVVMLGVVAVFSIGLIYVAVRLAIKHERKDSK